MTATLASTAAAPIDRTFRLGLAIGAAFGLVLGVAAGAVAGLGWLAAFVIGIVVSGLMWDLLSRPHRNGATEFVIGPDRLAAPADLTAYRNVVTLAFMGPMALGYLAMRRSPGEYAGFGSVGTGLSAGLLLAILGWSLWQARRAVIFTPAGLRFRRFTGYRTIAWAGVGRADRRRANRVGVELGGSIIVLPAAQVRPDLLAYAIDWYASHPAHATRIGTESEHTRLLAGFLADSRRA